MLSLIAGRVSGYFESRWCENRWTDTVPVPLSVLGVLHTWTYRVVLQFHIWFFWCAAVCFPLRVCLFSSPPTRCNALISVPPRWHLLCCYCFVTVTLKSYGQYLVVALYFPNKYRCWNSFTMTCLLSLEKCTFKSFAYLKVFCLCSPLMILVWGLKLKSLFCFELIFV